jgi:hypothetical protein
VPGSPLFPELSHQAEAIAQMEAITRLSFEAHLLA